jgi:hypothetical protein
MTKGFYVYAHSDEKGIIRYIGKGSLNRASCFLQRGKLWNETFQTPPRVKILVDGLSEEEAFEAEREIIAKGLDEGWPLINMHPGYGKGKWLMTETVINYLENHRRGKNAFWHGKTRDKETIAKLNEGKEKYIAEFGHPWLGKKRDPELIKKLTAAGQSPEAREKRRIAMTGRTLSEEHKAKIGAAGLGKKRSEETRRKISEGKKGRPNGLLGRTLSEETKRKMSESMRGTEAAKIRAQKVQEAKKRNGTARGYTLRSAKAVMCVETGKVYRCAKDAALDISGSDKHIQACCVGRRARHRDLTWKYV